MARLFTRYRRHKRLHVNFLGIELIYTSVFYRYRKSIWLLNVTSANGFPLRKLRGEAGRN